MLLHFFLHLFAGRKRNLAGEQARHPARLYLDERNGGADRLNQAGKKESGLFHRDDASVESRRHPLFHREGGGIQEGKGSAIAGRIDDGIALLARAVGEEDFLSVQKLHIGLHADPSMTEIGEQVLAQGRVLPPDGDRKSTRLNSSHVAISYAVFCWNKKRKKEGQA